jgi:hypothetical protein
LLVRKSWIAQVVVLSIAAGAGLILAQDAGSTAKNTVQEKKVAAGEVEAKRLLLLMDRDQNGKVSREEYMAFMAAEFELLDKNKDGALDVKELTQTRLTAPPRGAIHR